ncbi:MAG: ATP-binding protein [Candidatus Bathyarchaeia archaeon]
MSSCKRCLNRAEIYLPYAGLSLCSNCFKDFYWNRVKKTVEEFKMFKRGDRVAVAVSGGKDSGALLHALRSVYPNQDMVAVHLNLGIKKYSDHCQTRVEELTDSLNVKLKVVKLEDYGYTIDDFQKTRFKSKMCSICGLVKRHILDRVVQDLSATVQATGHNLDDVVGTMLTTFFSGDLLQLSRLKPVLAPKHPSQNVKVKPLIKTPEFENLIYCCFFDVPFRSLNCPHSRGTHSRRSKRLLEELSKGNAHFRQQTLSLFLARLIPIVESKLPQKPLLECQVCGMPSSNPVCAYCKRIGDLMVIKQPSRGLRRAEVSETSPRIQQ